MKNIHFKRLSYHIRHRYLTMNNLVVAIAAVIAISWAWASIGVVQKNYLLQREVDDKKRELQLTELETENLAFEQRYYKSAEFQALQVREKLGLVDKGEKLLILPPNTPAAMAENQDADTETMATNAVADQPSEVQQWANFLFGGNSKSL